MMLLKRFLGLAHFSTSLFDHFAFLVYWIHSMPHSERMVALYVVFVNGYGQIVMDGNIVLPVAFITEMWVPFGLDKNFVPHFQHCHNTTPKHKRKIKIRKRRSVVHFIF